MADFHDLEHNILIAIDRAKRELDEEDLKLIVESIRDEIELIEEGLDG